MTREISSVWRLSEQEKHVVLQLVPGGAHNVQEIYPLSTLQEGLLFHRLLNEQRDSYLLSHLFTLQLPDSTERLAAAVQSVINRHDALRTAILWEGLSKPVQVVYRQAMLPVEHVHLAATHAADLSRELMRPGKQPLPLTHAPLVRLQIISTAESPQMYGLLQVHHLVCDHRSLEIMVAEIMTSLAGREATLKPSIGYKEFIAIQSEERQRVSEEEQFFQAQLADVEESTAPYGLLDVYGDGSELDEVRCVLDEDLHRDVRRQVAATGFSAARLFHAAWALVIARTSGRDDIVFGTVLSALRDARETLESMLGMAVNTLPLRVQLKGMSALELLAQVDRQLRATLHHVHTPLTLAQRCSGCDGAPLFTSLFNFRHASQASHTSNAACGVQSKMRGEAWTNYPLTMTIDDRGDRFEMTVQADRRIEAHRIGTYLQAALRSLLDALDRNASGPLLREPILPKAELERILRDFRGANTEYPQEKSLHALFEEQVSRTPHATAAVYEEQTVSYEELNARANRLARYLLRQGIVAGDYVPVLMDRSLDLLVAQIALAKIGCAYVPLDAEAPAARQAFMAREAGGTFLLSHHGRPTWLTDEQTTVINVPEVRAQIQAESQANLDVPVSSEAPVYVMFTSGSTGQPKGVVVCHRNVSRLAIRNGFAEIGPDDCLVHYSNPTFDASTFEVWGALLNGARLIIVPQSVVLEPTRFAQRLLSARVNVLWMSVGLFNQYAQALADVLPRLRYLMVGGDALDPQTIREVMRRSPPAVLLNAYGPTECTTFATMHHIERIEETERAIPIGRAVANGHLYILDAYMNPVPIGVVGEIYIGGGGVSLGYLNRPALTASRFIPDMFSGSAGGRLYKTGDLGRWRVDGAIEFMGRNDQQVKIRGFRVEPGEIEAQLLRHESVREALVVPRGGAAEKRRLIAYLTLQPTSQIAPSSVAEVMRSYLKSSLPDYMVPSVFVTLERMPLTSNGKVDKRALPEPGAEAYVREAYEAPQTPLEQELAEIWQAVLQVERVGRNDDFFDLGGHSLLAMQVAARINAVMLAELPVKEVFDRRTLRELAEHITYQQEAKLLSALESGPAEVEQWLGRLNSMSEDGARELLKELMAKEGT